MAWSSVAPWSDPRQVEQDLIISRAIVDLFSDDMLRKELRFRGGTALNKLHFPSPLRYSEDIDLVRTTAGGIGPILDRIRLVLEPWLGRAAFDQSPVAPKLRFRVPPEGMEDSGPLRLKLEINTSEIEALDGEHLIRFAVDNPWYRGHADVPTFSLEEMLATKLRALLQRDKGRDLLDLGHALNVAPMLDDGRIVRLFLAYLVKSKVQISRAEAERRMFAKLDDPRFMTDIRPLLPVDIALRLTDQVIMEHFAQVFRRLVSLIPGRALGRSQRTAAAPWISIVLLSAYSCLGRLLAGPPHCVFPDVGSSDGFGLVPSAAE
ncbi:MAG: nucleotidyl transferase AbiEii/AbiGii toxin family protein [Pseudomonadota bacterium]|nr:nucleotidyl transferase AbiEii/AbiGii toxin family protein [Pseudomonadota bacterium]